MSNKYKVTYEKEVVIVYEAEVVVNSEEEAMDKACAGEIIREIPVNHKEIEKRPLETEKLD